MLNSPAVGVFIWRWGEERKTLHICVNVYIQCAPALIVRVHNYILCDIIALAVTYTLPALFSRI